MTEQKFTMPLFLIKPGTISKADIKRAEKHCGIIIVECSEPDAARYSQPPITATIPEQAQAALGLFRWIMSYDSMTRFCTAGYVQTLREASHGRRKASASQASCASEEIAHHAGE